MRLEDIKVDDTLLYCTDDKEWITVHVTRIGRPRVEYKERGYEPTISVEGSGYKFDRLRASELYPYDPKLLEWIVKKYDEIDAAMVRIKEIREEVNTHVREFMLYLEARNILEDSLDAV